MKTSSKQLALQLRIRAWINALIGMAALWVVAYALTGDLLRSFMFCGALFLMNLCFKQFRSQLSTADMIEYLPFIKKFDEEMKDNAVIGEAGEPLKSNEPIYFDPKTGEFRRIK